MVIELPLLERLREETRGVHEALERDLPLTNPDLTLAQYRDVLARFYSFYEPFESSVVPTLPDEWLTLYEERHKLQALINDLEFIGCGNDELRRCATFPDYSGVPRILGALYVVEGSTLGGQLITRHVRQVLGLNENEGLQFFSSYGAEVGSRWKSFRSLLQQYSSAETDGQIVEGARVTFATMHTCLTGEPA